MLFSQVDNLISSASLFLPPGRKREALGKSTLHNIVRVSNLWRRGGGGGEDSGFLAGDVLLGL